jgi:hypothetical protein
MKISHDVWLKRVLVVAVCMCGVLIVEVLRVEGLDSRSIIGYHSK